MKKFEITWTDSGRKEVIIGVDIVHALRCSGVWGCAGNFDWKELPSEESSNSETEEFTAKNMCRLTQEELDKREEKEIQEQRDSLKKRILDCAKHAEFHLNIEQRFLHSRNREWLTKLGFNVSENFDPGSQRNMVMISWRPNAER